MDKFGRNYSLTIQVEEGNPEGIIIKPPFTLEFDINRNYLATVSNSAFRIYNLSEKNRSQIRKDLRDWGLLRQIAFKAGYGEKLTLAVAGNITQAFSVREGNNFITQVECFDGGFAFENAIVNTQYPEGTPQKTIAEDLVRSLADYGIKKGAIGDIPGSISRGNAYTGNTCNVLREITTGNFFIDGGKANILGENEVIESTVFVINSSSGLLGTPTRENSLVNLTMLFEPRIDVGHLVKIESTTEKNFNGFYKVAGIKHKGIISESVSGTATTSLTLVKGYGDFITVRSGS